MTQLQFELLRVGHCRQSRRMACRAESWTKLVAMRDFPATVALLRHPQHGPILFDTGYAPDFITATRSWPERLYRLSTPMTLPAEQHLPAQLAARGLAANDIGLVVLSHFHADHVAGLKAVSQARIYCAQAGWDEIRGIGRMAGVRQGLLPSLLPHDFASRAAFVETRPRVQLPPAMAPFRNGYDLFGDGSLLTVDLPGHATGQFGLCCRIDDDRHLFLVADAAFSMQSIRLNAPPMWLAGRLIGHHASYATTLGQLHELHRQSPEVLIVPAHCDERVKELVR